MWNDKAADIGRTVKQLNDIWYKSVRTRVGKLAGMKSGGPQFDVEGCSDRQKYLADKIQFMILHEVQKRPTVSVSNVTVFHKRNQKTRQMTVIYKVQIGLCLLLFYSVLLVNLSYIRSYLHNIKKAEIGHFP